MVTRMRDASCFKLPLCHLLAYRAKRQRTNCIDVPWGAERVRHCEPTARNDVVRIPFEFQTAEIHVRILAASNARGLLDTLPLLNTEGAGKTGCALHPRSRVQHAQEKRTRAYRFSGGIPAFPAQWFYGLLRALLGDRLSCHRHSTGLTAKLDASIGASGPHDFAVRVTRRSSKAHQRPPHPTARFVTIATRPSFG